MSTTSTVCLPIPSVGHTKKTDLFHCPVCLFETGHADWPFSRSCLCVVCLSHLSDTDGTGRLAIFTVPFVSSCFSETAVHCIFSLTLWCTKYFTYFPWSVVIVLCDFCHSVICDCNARATVGLCALRNSLGGRWGSKCLDADVPMGKMRRLMRMKDLSLTVPMTHRKAPQLSPHFTNWNICRSISLF